MMNAKTIAFQTLVEAQLESLGGIRFRKMFGGFGLYSGEIFFGILHGEKLYFHTDDRTQKRYAAAGKTCFVTPGRKKQIKRYYEVPESVIGNSRELTKWAREALSSVDTE